MHVNDDIFNVLFKKTIIEQITVRFNSALHRKHSILSTQGPLVVTYIK